MANDGNSIGYSASHNAKGWAFVETHDGPSPQVTPQMNEGVALLQQHFRGDPEKCRTVQSTEAKKEGWSVTKSVGQFIKMISSLALAMRMLHSSHQLADDEIQAYMRSAPQSESQAFATVDGFATASPLNIFNPNRSDAEFHYDQFIAMQQHEQEKSLIAQSVGNISPNFMPAEAKKMVDVAKTIDDPVTKALAVNLWVSRVIHYDYTKYSHANDPSLKNELWDQALLTTLVREEGVCIDQAIATYELSTQAGVPKKDISILDIKVKLSDENYSGYHSMVIMNAGDKKIILNNGADETRGWTEAGFFKMAPLMYNATSVVPVSRESVDGLQIYKSTRTGNQEVAPDASKYVSPFGSNVSISDLHKVWRISNMADRVTAMQHATPHAHVAPVTASLLRK